MARGLEVDRPAWPLAAACAIFIGGLLGKETGTIASAVAGAWGASRLIPPAGRDDRRRVVVRTLVVVLIVGAVSGAICSCGRTCSGRRWAPDADLDDERTGFGPELRAFLLRSFWPPGAALAWLWSTHYHRIVFAAGATILAIRRDQGGARRQPVFGGARRGAFIERRAYDTPDCAYEAFSPTDYIVRFRTPRHAVAAYTTAGQLRKAGDIQATPFGALDVPADGRACEGASVRFSGWALDEQPGVEVRLETSAIGAGRSAASLPVEWRTGTRPDVARIFAEFPGTERAEWDAYLPCAAVEAARDVRVTAIARNVSGVEATLGTRTVRSR